MVNRKRPSHDDGTGALYREILRLPLLTRQQEQALGAAVTLRRKALAYAAALADPNSVQEPEARARLVEEARGVPVERWMREGDRAVRVLTERNVRLVFSMARRALRLPGVEVVDLVQEGMLGLIRAAERFDPDMGTRFSTYAVWWIRQAMQRGCGSVDGAATLPPNVQQRYVTYAQAHAYLTRRLKRRVSVEETCAWLGWNAKVGHDLLVHVRRAVPLEAQDVLEDGASREIVGDDAPGPEDLAGFLQARMRLRCMLAQLKPRERDILERRFALDGGEPESLQSIADDWGLSRERIRQIEEKLVRRLRDVQETAEIRFTRP
ncbi:sigma-70 family RNA polymerase sigma factor [Patescibacteria group bacterium]|nr:MAG: sigma-70 family RNA polymerase sigma factor [Patescibacteria group bacterium]